MKKTSQQRLLFLKDKYELTDAVFGDIDLQPHRDWEEMVCKAAGLTAVLPLWQEDRLQLVNQMIEAGIQTMIVSCNEIMGEKFLGKYINASVIEELQSLKIDPCGENGEFHTLVTDCPLFHTPIKVEVTEKLMHEQYWFCRLALIKNN